MMARRASTTFSFGSRYRSRIKYRNQRELAARVIEGRQIEHARVLQLGKVRFLLIEREELLVRFPVTTQLTDEIVAKTSLEHLETPPVARIIFIHRTGDPFNKLNYAAVLCSTASERSRAADNRCCV